MGEEESNFVKYNDFNIKNLELQDMVEMKDGANLMKIKYNYPDGKKRNLRLRTPILSSYGVHPNNFLESGYYMTLSFFNNEGLPTEKEITFKKKFDGILKFLQEEGSKKSNIGRERFASLDYSNSVYAKLCTKKYGLTNFYVKSETGELKKIEEDRYLGLGACKIIAYLDLMNIYLGRERVSLGIYLSDVIILVRTTSKVSSKVTLYSDDQE